MSWDDLDQAASVGLSTAWWADRAPDRLAIISPHGDRSFAELDAQANRVARALRSGGLEAGDGIALLCPNRTEFAEVYFGALRTGVRLTPVNWHLRPDEVAYVVANSKAKALVADARFVDACAAALLEATNLVACWSVGGSLEGFRRYEEVISAFAGSLLENPELGDTMLYTSGTTGRPKGVRRAMTEPSQAVRGWKVLVAAFDFRRDAEDCALATGPLYHSGPLNLCLAIPVNNGIPTVLMERWDAEDMLRLMERHGVTHVFCVPTMFRRLLALPEDVRNRYQTSKLRFVIHGAAPCPVEDKRAMIDWWGPILTEIYAATEGMGSLVSSAEWLERPGTVGRVDPERVRVCDADFKPVPAGEVGTVFLQPVGGADFEYFGEKEKTRDAKRDGYFSVGDMGYVDDEGYLFLTGRSAEVVISGGTNIYPAEIDSVLIAHPAVADAAAVGVPDPEWGEVVKAVVVPVSEGVAGEVLAEQILEHCRRELPTFKVPRSVDFVDEIPRSDAGKILRRRLRDAYVDPAGSPPR